MDSNTASQAEKGQESAVSLSLRMRKHLASARREKLLEELAGLLKYAMKQVESQRPTNQLKMGWVKTSAYLIQVANSVIKDGQIEDIERRLDLLETVRQQD